MKIKMLAKKFSGKTENGLNIFLNLEKKYFFQTFTELFVEM